MSNSDLAALLDEVKFSTPERAFEDLGSTVDQSNPNNENERAIKIATQRKSVLISDSSLTRPAELFENFEKRDSDTIPSSTYGVITDGPKDFPGKGGTSPSILSEDR